MKLVYKLFAAFLFTSLLIVALMAGIMHYFASEHFADYVAREEMARLSGIYEVLKADYQRHNNWENIRNNRLLWDQILREHQPEGSEDEPPPRPAPPEAGLNRDGKPVSAQPRPAPLIARRLTLYDAHKRFVEGRREVPQNQIVRAIDVDGQTVGWLGLSRKKDLTDPLQLHFIYEQTRAFVWVAGGILFFAALLAFALSRHLLRPIRQLTAGAHALASRRFDTRVDVHSADELGSLAADFNKMANTLERYEFMRRQWIADVSHELRTPLAVLRGEIEAVLDGVRDMRRETLESAHTEVLLLSKIIDDLHALTIIESESLAMTRERVDVVGGAAGIIKVFEPRFAEGGIEVQNNLAVNEVCDVMGDADRLAQVFSNLCENTLRYTDTPGKMRIRSEKKGNAVLLVIEDSAPGVPDSAIPFIFDRLYRVDRSRSRKKGGSGLGMAITKAIIDAHGGTITASSSSLGGLKIEITLPLVQEG